METKIEKLDGNVVKLDINIPAKDAISYYNAAARKIAQYANIPGFRKGKAPRNIVEQHFGEESIKQEALETTLPKIFDEIIKENSFRIAVQPYVESYTYNIGEDLKVTAKIELKPEVTLGEYKGMNIDVEAYKIPDDDFDKLLNRTLEQNATTVTVTDRKTIATDTIIFDFEGYVGDEKIEHGDAKNYSLDLAHSSFIPGFADQLVDRAIDEDFDVNVTFPEDYHEKKLAGKAAVFKCRIHEITAKILPELTDESVQKMGNYKTVDDLKANIQSVLNDKKEDMDRVNSEQAVFEKVINNAKVDIQQSMIDREADNLANEYKQRLQMQGFTWEQAVEAQGYDEIMKSLKEDATSRVKNSLVLGKIAENENIKLEQMDIAIKLSQLCNMYNMDAETFRKELSHTPGAIDAISQQVLNEKVMSFLVANNTVNLK